MPDFQHFRFSYSRMNPSSGESARAAQQARNPGSDTECAESPDPGCCFGGLDPGSLSNSFQYHPIGSLYRASLPPFPPPPPPAAVLRNDLGSNISVLKTLNLRFRCFLAKVHELERRNKALENQLQQALEANNNNQNNNDRGCEGHGKGDGTVQSGPDFIASLNANDSACLTRTLLGPTQNGTRNKLLVGDMEPNFNFAPSSLLNPVSPVDPKPVSGIRPTYESKGTERFSKSTSRVLPNSVWFHNPAARFSNSWETRVPAPRVSWPFQDGVGVQIDTITPEIRALNNVLAKVKLERDEYKLRSAYLHEPWFKVLRAKHAEILLYNTAYSFGPPLSILYNPDKGCMIYCFLKYNQGCTIPGKNSFSALL